MASPVVAGTAESSTNTAGTSHVLNWTGLGTVAAGDLLLIVMDIGSTAATLNAHADYTELLDENVANGLKILYRWATGGETAPTFVTSASTRSAEITYRLTGAENPATQAPQIGTTATGTSATPNPPASATPPSSKDYLFIAFYGAAGEEADDDTWSDTPPTNYTPSPPRQKACGIAGTNLGGLIAAAERALTTGVAEDPGTFAKDVSVAWRAQTIMVHPASSTTFFQTIAATEVGVAAFLKLISHLLPNVQSPGLATLATSFRTFRTLAATEIAVATLTAVKLVTQALSAIAGSLVTLIPVATFVATLSAVAVSTATLIKLVRTTLAATAGSTASLLKGLFVTLAATEVAVASLTAVKTFIQALVATAGSVTTLASAVTRAVTLAAVEVGVAVLTTAATFFRTLAATEVSAAGLSLVKTFLRTLSVAVVSVTTLTTARTFIVSMAATMVAAFARTFKQALPSSEVVDAVTEQDKLDIADRVWTHATGTAVSSKVGKVLKKNEATTLPFVMVSTTDHVTPTAGLTVSGQGSQVGGGFVDLINAVAEVGVGVYKVALTAAEMNTNVLTLRFTATGADPRILTIVTQQT